MKSTKSVRTVNTDKKDKAYEASKNLKPVDKDVIHDASKETNGHIHHPKREENISALIVPETQRMITDELLTEEDETVTKYFQKLKGEITTISAASKIDYAEILDDKWALFSKYIHNKSL